MSLNVDDATEVDATWAPARVFDPGSESWPRLSTNTCPGFLRLRFLRLDTWNLLLLETYDHDDDDDDGDDDDDDDDEPAFGILRLGVPPTELTAYAACSSYRDDRALRHPRLLSSPGQIRPRPKRTTS